MKFWVSLIKTPDNNKFLEENCTHVVGGYWIYEGCNEVLGDELNSHEVIAEGAVPSLGGMTPKQLTEGCSTWFGVDVNEGCGCGFKHL